MIPPALASPTAPLAELEPLLETLGLPSGVQRGVARVVTQAVTQVMREARPAGSGEPSHDLPGGWRLEQTGPGGLWLYGPPTRAQPDRPWAFIDRAGRIQTLLRWAESQTHPPVPNASPAAGAGGGPGARLEQAALRLPAGGWLELHPGRADHPLWGISDRITLRRGGAAVQAGCFQALEYGQIHHIPPFDQPALLPPGGGETLLNFLAALLVAQGRERVCYRGPYPTENLFRSLLRCFRHEGPEEAALARFTRAEAALAFSSEMAENPVAWTPSPFEPVASREGLTVWLRDGVQTAWLGGHPFRRGCERRGTESEGGLQCGARVWREEGRDEPRFHVGLAALGSPLHRYLVLDGDGRVVEELASLPSGPPRPAGKVSDPWREVIFAWAALNSTRALAPAITRLRGSLPLHWAELGASLADLHGEKLLIHRPLAARFREVQATRGDAETALMLVSDILISTLPHLRRMARRNLENEVPRSAGDMLRAGGEAQQAARDALEKALPALTGELLGGRALPRGRGLPSPDEA